MGQFGFGQPVPREEDPYLLRGAGRYVSDVKLPNEAHAYVLRSPYAHAKVLSIDTSSAENATGVLLVLTAATPEVAALGAQTPRMARQQRDGSPAFVTPQPVLQNDTVRYVGEAVAFVIAETVAHAKDAAEMIFVDYDALPAVTDTGSANDPDTPAIWADCPTNEAYVHQAGDKEATDAAFAKAAHVVSHRMVINRITANAMEPRGCISFYDKHESRFTVRCTVQSPHRVRGILANQILKVPESEVRVISENVGGGFGMKGGCYPEYALSALAARMLDRPVKWICERSEGLVTDEQARDNVTVGELALDADGNFLGLRVRTNANGGAYNTSDRNSGPAVGNIGVLAGTYKTPAIHVEVAGVMTNSMLTAHYRGAGRPEAAYVIETLVDLAARELGRDPVDLRKQNTIPSDAMPFKTGLVYTYDSGDFLKNLEMCTSMADYAGFAARKQDSTSRGKLRGIGVSNTIEASNAGMLEHAEIRFDPSGNLTLSVGTHDHGQGHETMYKQILAQSLGIDPERVRFRYGDTDLVMAGTGTFGSRSAACGGTAALMASEKVIEKGTKIAAHALEVAEGDIEFADGAFTVAGTDRSIDLIDVAKRSYQIPNIPEDMEPGLFETGTYSGGTPTFPNGCHICELEIDPDTGEVEIMQYKVVDDVGNVVNPLLLKGQIHGGIAQGLGQALLEDIILDPESGQVVTGSFMDYCMPRADDFCSIEIDSNVVPTNINPLGVKGAGEAGCVGSLPAVMNALNNALADIGADYVQMPATPEKIWGAIQAANRAAA